MVASINYLYSQITKESSHIISLYNRVKSGAEGVNPFHTSDKYMMLLCVVLVLIKVKI